MSNLILHSGQKEALEQIVQIVEQPAEGDFPRIVALTGISGVGKDLLWDAAKDKFGDDNFVPDYSLQFEPRRYRSRKGNIFTTVIPLELGMIRWPGDIVSVIIKGMNPDEMSGYLTQFTSKFGEFTEEQLVEYSLGIPLLAQRLLQNQCIREEELAMVAGSHVRSSVSRKLSKAMLEDPKVLDDYLSIRMNDKVMEAFKNPQSSGICSISPHAELPRVLERQGEINRRYRKNLEKPFFVCPESAELYTDMFASDGKDPDFNLFAPNLSPVQCKKIEEELFLPFAEYHLQVEGTRFEMFGGDFRKVTMVLDNGRRTLIASTEGEPGDIRLFQQAYSDGQLSINPIEGNPRSLYFHAHEHSGLQSNQLIVGMATETLLQHMGVEYVVDYGMSEKAFKYNPENNSLPEIGRFARDVIRGKS